MSKQEREIVGDCAFAVVEVGMAYSASLHLDERLSGIWVRHYNRLD